MQPTALPETLGEFEEKGRGERCGLKGKERKGLWERGLRMEGPTLAAQCFGAKAARPIEAWSDNNILTRNRAKTTDFILASTMTVSVGLYRNSAATSVYDYPFHHS